MHAKQKIDEIIQEQKHKTTALSVMIHPIALPITHTRRTVRLRDRGIDEIVLRARVAKQTRERSVRITG